jgi:ferredoxin
MALALREITVKVHVDSKASVGHPQCAANEPDAFTLNELGNAEEPKSDVLPKLLAQSKRGADACPKRTITLSGSRGRSAVAASKVQRTTGTGACCINCKQPGRSDRKIGTSPMRKNEGADDVR